MKLKLQLFSLILIVSNSVCSQTELETMTNYENTWNAYFLLPDSLRSDSLYHALRYRNESYFDNEFLPELEGYSKSVAKGDTALMKKYMEFMVSAKGSANEAITIYLAEMYYRWPEVFLRHALTYNQEGRHSLYFSVVWGLFNIFCGEIDWEVFDSLFYNIPNSNQDSLKMYYPEFMERYKMR